MKSITEVQMICQNCNWIGPVIDCKPDIDGDSSLGCPRCGKVATETDKEKERMRIYNIADNKLEDLQEDYQRKRQDIDRWLKGELEKVGQDK